MRLRLYSTFNVNQISSQESLRRSTYESGGVVVTDGLGVTVGLKRRIGLDNLLLERTGVRALGSLGLGGLMKENEEKKKDESTQTKKRQQFCN